MPGRIHRPLHLPASTWNRLITERIDKAKERIATAVAGDFEMFPDKGFITALPIDSRQMYAKMLSWITDVSDFQRIADPNYEVNLRAGLMPDDPGVQSPNWKAMLSIPGMFTQKAKEFVKLNERFAEPSHAVAHSPQHPPLAAGGGLPLPAAPAPGPPQSRPGGYPGGTGAP